MLSAIASACKSNLAKPLRHVLGSLVARMLPVGLFVTVAACVPSEQTSQNTNANTAKSVQVALLVPSGGPNNDQVLADSLVNGAKLAVADLAGTTIDLRIYPTAGSPGQAQAAALQAVNEGADVILGPLFAEEANAAGLAVAAQGVNVLAFSNNADIAGGNVFVLGPTFQNTSTRLAGYAAKSGRNRFMIAHDRNTTGEAGRIAISRGIAATGGTVTAVSDYEFSQNGVASAAPVIVTKLKDSGANALFLTADAAGALPMLSQLLVDNGLDTTSVKLIGITRWDIPLQTLSLPGLQGGWFALPDPAMYNQFQSRYLSAYGAPPHAVAGLAYDGIAAIGALSRQGKDMSAASLTQNAGFVGVSGIFRLRPNGTNERGLAVAEIRNNQVVVIDPAPRSFPNAGF